MAIECKESMNTIVLNGRNIDNEDEFHTEFAKRAQLGSGYGRNRDALYDVLTGDIEWPVKVIWEHASQSKVRMGAAYDEVVGTLLRAVQHAKSGPYPDDVQVVFR